MKKLIISVLGRDRPGIIAAVSRILFEHDCNIENVSQTILQTEFSGTFVVSIPEEPAVEILGRCLDEELEPLGLSAFVKDLPFREPDPTFIECEKFIITTQGPDRKGLVAGITEVIASHGVNVTNLQAVFKGGDDPGNNIMIYEVDIPASTDQQALTEALRRRATSLSLQIDIQHRNIFEAINRI